MLVLEFAIPEDDGFVYEVYSDLRRAEMDAWGWPDEESEAFLRMQFDLQTRSYAMQFPNAVTQVIMHEGKKIGRMIVSRNHSIHLIDISLLTAYRNKGLGTAAMAGLQQEATLTGLPLKLSVLGNNPAKLLYERLGFKTIGEAFPYISMSWEPDMREEKIII
ncbi:GNAT family N-acetyltransferase [Paenibacillus sp. YAF4_2]|uniref:GNAT family N-acetyltransferase n=1 Tax=Paenibacillus sp. YAF4_2 TaxID=3233085 RepID=UPI003F9CFF18